MEDKERKVISVKNFPARPPIYTTIIIWLVMDRLNASQLAYGIVGTLVFVLWVYSIYRWAHQKEVDLFENDQLKD